MTTITTTDGRNYTARDGSLEISAYIDAVDGYAYVSATLEGSPIMRREGSHPIDDLMQAATDWRGTSDIRALVYGAIEGCVLDARRRQKEERDRREAQARAKRIRQCPGHRAVSESEPTSYTGPVAPAGHENRAAHGNIQVTETCSCGAQRNVLINQRHVEFGVWS